MLFHRGIVKKQQHILISVKNVNVCYNYMINFLHYKNILVTSTLFWSSQLHA